MKSILTDKNVSEDTVKIEADVIVTATVLGFIGTRYHQNQPCGFDREHPRPEDFRIWEVINLLAGVPKEGETLKDAQGRIIFKIQKLWREIEETDESFYGKHKIEEEIKRLQENFSLFDNLKIERDERSRSENQKALDEQYHNYLAKRLILDLEKRYPEQSLSNSLRNAIKSNQEDIEDTTAFLDVLSAMSIVLNKTDPKIGKHLKDSQSPEWKPGALITGLKGGAGVDFRDRHRQIISKKAKKWAKRFAANEDHFFYYVYQGRGAYTGMIDNPQDSDSYFIRPTRRVIDVNERNERWHPDQNNRNRWGLIGGEKDVNLSEDRTIGMGDFPKLHKPLLRQGGIVGYIHGMSSAICKCIELGPWCTPFEMAVGEHTTKMASCFACCTYMYAAGYPPSSMHLGRGESWVPPSLKTQKDGEKIEITDHILGDLTKPTPPFAFTGLKNEFDEEITSSVLTRWHREVYDYMTLGVHYLLNATSIESQNKSGEKNFLKEIINKDKAKNFTNIEFVNKSHLEAIHLLHNKLLEWSDKKNPDNNKIISEQGGNLFLDALTVHQSDWKRIKNTLSPVFQNMVTKQIDVSKKTNTGKNKNKFDKTSKVLSLSQGLSNSSRASTLPTMASTGEPVLLNGMKVIFDEPASVYPVTLTQND